MKIAFLGLGIMGRPMAANLVKAGHEVSVWNRTPKNVEGARTAATPADAAKGVDVVWMCVADTSAVEHVLFGPNGVEGSLRPGMIVVDSSTIAPSGTLKFAQRVRAKGADFVDAPVTGSKIGAEAGQLLFIVGGSEKSLATLDPLFAAMGKKYIRVGETGAGGSAKIGMNLIIALMFEGLAEGLTLTKKLGVPSEILFDLVQNSMLRSGVSDYKGPFLLKRDFSPNFPLRLMHKDIRLMLESAGENGVKLPALEKVEEIYRQSAEHGLRDEDYIATIKTLEKLSGLS